MKNGFSLLELILVLGVGTTLAFLKFQDMLHDQEEVKASAAGQQIKQLGEAVNGYINIRYDKLSTLSNSAGTGTDPGPRTCTTSNSVCSITYQTLINEGLLPSTYVARNSFGSDYSIQLKRSGTSPNYIIDGIIVTNSSWIEGGNIRYDLLGKAMQSAGIDSGMTKSATQLSGYGNNWNYLSSGYPAITKAGMLGYRVGYNSAMYSVYLRRDGTLPMTGNLNMGGQSIYNTQDITAAGTTTTGILKTNSAATVGTTLNVGGVTTLGSDLNVAGNGQVNGNLNSNNTVSGTTVTSRGETYTQNWFRTLGDGGIYFQKYGGGWNMGDTATINAFGGKNVQTTAGFYGGYVHSNGNIDANGTVNAQYVWASGNLNSNYVHSNGNIDANGRVNAGEFVYVNGQANIGWGCSPNGLIGRTGSGNLVSCVNGIWKAAGQGSIYYNSATATAYRFPSASVYCNGNDIALGGGGQCSSRSGYIWLTGNRPVGDNGWFASCDQNKTDDGNSTIVTYVKCSSQ
ncbi:prepilin cleavage protein [Shigella flexneri]